MEGPKPVNGPLKEKKEKMELKENWRKRRRLVSFWLALTQQGILLSRS